MKPICFPSTYVPDCVAQALAACFGQFIVYQPSAGKVPEQMLAWVERGVLDIRVPVTEDQNEFEAVVKNYLNWADLHFDGSGQKPPFLQTWKNSIPFFDTSSSSQVVADIKTLHHGKTTSSAPEPLLAARLFLYFAQEFDRQNQEVVQDLKRHRQQEIELIRRLKMEDDSLTAQFQKKDVQKPDESADYLVLDRLRAWSQIFLTDTAISGIFITHTPAVLQELLNYSPTAQKLFSIESVPTGMALTDQLAAWREQLVLDLAHIVEHKWSQATPGLSKQPSFRVAEKTVSLSVYLVPDLRPRVFFSRFAHIRPPDGDIVFGDGSFKNTVIGLIEFKK